MNKVFKYATGQEVPEGAVYLKTLKQTEIISEETKKAYPCWLVWHYFLVEVKE